MAEYESSIVEELNARAEKAERELAEARAEIERKDWAINRAGAYLSQGAPGGALDALREALAAPAPEPIPHRFRPSEELERGCTLCGQDSKADIHREEPTPEREAERRLAKAVPAIKIGTGNHWAPPHCLSLTAVSGPEAQEFLLALADYKAAQQQALESGDAE